MSRLNNYRGLCIEMEALKPTIANESEETAEHYQEERILRLRELAATPIPGASRAYDWIGGDTEAIEAFRRLMVRLDRYQDVRQNRRLCRTGGSYRGALHGLAALAHHHSRWIKPPESWHSTVQRGGQPKSADQFGSLARHLLAQYDVPTFMDEVWFDVHIDEALERQQWFIQLGSGASVRDLTLPVRFTRRMAHQFMLGKNRDSVAHNLRWAQVLGLGGDQQMARTILKTRLGRHLEHDEFWHTVVLFLANNPLIDPTQVGPMIDYVHNMRFAPCRLVREGGGVDEAPPPQPDLTMKGRSPTKLLRQVDAWHGHLTRVQDVVLQSWHPGPIRPWTMEDETAELGSLRWSVQELLSSWELAAEGTALNHCVVSYSDQCADGQTSVWSIVLQRPDQEMRESVLTVAVDVKKRVMTQARGRHNMLPG